jgi:hypothetical protein
MVFRFSAADCRSAVNHNLERNTLAFTQLRRPALDR